MSSLSNNSTVINAVHAQTAGVSTPSVTILDTTDYHNDNIDYSSLSSVIVPTRVKDVSDDNSAPFKVVVIPKGDNGFVIEVSDWCQLFIADANLVRYDGEITVSSLPDNTTLPRTSDNISGRERGEWKRITSPIPKGIYRISNQSTLDCSMTHIYAAPVNDVDKRKAADKIVREIVKSQLTSSLLTKAGTVDKKVPIARVQTNTDSTLSSEINSIITNALATDPIKTKIDVAIANNETTLASSDMNIAKNQVLNSVMSDPSISTIVEGIKSDIGSTSSDVVTTINNVIKEKTYTATESAINYIINNSNPVSSHPSTTAKVVQNGKSTATGGKVVIIPDIIVEMINEFTSKLTGETNIARWEQLFVDNIKDEPESNMVYMVEQLILGITGYDYDSAVTLAMMIVAMHSQL